MVRSRTRMLTFLGLMVALNIVLTRMASVRIALGGIEGIRIGLGAFPVLFGGFVAGPVGGAFVGALGDLIGFFLNPLGPYMPHFTLIAALRGLLPPLLWVGFHGNREGGSFPLLCGVFGISLGVTSGVALPLTLQSLFGLPLELTLPGAWVSILLTTPIFGILAWRLLPRIPQSSFCLVDTSRKGWNPFRRGNHEEDALSKHKLQ